MAKSRLKSGLVLGVALGGIVTTTPAWAQSSSDDSASGDIIVTARRTEERLQDVPISITVFNQQAISNRNVVTATDLAIYTPSLSVNQRFGPEKASYSIRGFVQENTTAPSVGVYFADVPFGRAQGGTTSGGTAPVGSFMDLQNVQVLKGPQGTLFGRNTTGGAVLLVPNKPTDRLEGWVEGSAGNYSMWRGQGVLNVPLADTFKVRLAVDRQKRDGYMKNHSGIGDDSFNDVNYFAARLGIVADLTPDLENYTVATYSHSFANGYAGRIVACNPNIRSGVTGLTASAACEQIARQNARGDGPLDVEISNPDPYINLRFWQATNTTTWKASDTLTVKNIASYQEFRERASYNLNGDNYVIPNVGTFRGVAGFDAATINPALPFTLPAGVPFQHVQLNPPDHVGNNSAQSTFTEELQLQGNTGKLTWVAGGYLEISRPLGFSAGRTTTFAQCADASVLDCTNPLFIGGISQSATKASFTTKALFAQGTYNFTDQLSATAGIRYTWDKTQVQAQSTRLSLGIPAFGTQNTIRCNDIIHFPGEGPGLGLKVTDPSKCSIVFPTQSNKPTWLIGLDYKPTSDILVYAKYARGYRQGGANPTNIAFETWQPEKVDTYEVGAKVSFRGAVPGYLNVTGFYNDFTNQQLVASAIGNQQLVPGFSGSQPVINAGKSRIQGIEVDGSATFFENLRFDVGYSFLDTKLQSINLPTTVPNIYLGLVANAVVGGPLSLSPKHRLTLTGTYTLPLDESIGKISLSATYVYTSENYFNRADDPFIPCLGGPLQPGTPNPCAGGQQFRTANVEFFGPNLGLLPASNLVNINVNWNKVMGSPVDAAFFMTNATNEQHPVAAGSSTSSNGNEYFLYGPPRMWGFRLRYSFGQ